MCWRGGNWSLEPVRAGGNHRTSMHVAWVSTKIIHFISAGPEGLRVWVLHWNRVPLRFTRARTQERTAPAGTEAAKDGHPDSAGSRPGSPDQTADQ